MISVERRVQLVLGPDELECHDCPVVYYNEAEKACDHTISALDERRIDPAHKPM
jgi:hypothetical protein